MENEGAKQLVSMCVKILYIKYPAENKIISCSAKGTGKLAKGAANSKKNAY